MTNTINWDKGDDGIVTLTIDDPNQRVNTMNADFQSSLQATVQRLEDESDDITGVILTSGKQTFFAGGDLRPLLLRHHRLQLFRRHADDVLVLVRVEVVAFGRQFLELDTLGQHVLLPGLMRRLMNEDDSALNERLQPLMAWLFHVPSPNALNTALAMTGAVKPVFRLPYAQVCREARQIALEMLRTFSVEERVGNLLELMEDEQFELSC